MMQAFSELNNYGLFVWLSFAITIILCAIIYYKTYKTLKKYEKDFAKELGSLPESERKLVLEKSKVATQIFASYNKSA